MALCLKCGGQITSLVTEGITASVPFGKTFNGVVYSCPHCQTALGAGIDPVAIQSDALLDIEQMLRTIEKKLDGRG